jgi:hypothetical protein
MRGRLGRVQGRWRQRQTERARDGVCVSLKALVIGRV